MKIKKTKHQYWAFGFGLNNAMFEFQFYKFNLKFYFK